MRYDFKASRSLLIKASQGLGKTTALLRTVADIRERMKIIMLVHSLAKADETKRDYDENIDTAKMPAFVFRGRSAVNPDSGEKMCARHEVAKQVIDCGLNVIENLCKHCPFHDSCAYLAQYDKISTSDATMIIGAHEYLFLDIFSKESDLLVCDLLVIDESVLPKAVGEYAFSPERIVNCVKWNIFTNNPPALKAKAVLQTIYSALELPGMRSGFLKRVRNSVTKQELWETVDFLEKYNEINFAIFDGRDNDQAIIQILKEYKRSDKYKIVLMLKQLAKEYDTGRPDCISIQLISDAIVEDSNQQKERQCRIQISFLKAPILADNTPLLILDGSADINLVRALFGPDIECQEFMTERNAHVVQVTGKEFSDQSITGVMANDKPFTGKRLEEAEKFRKQIAEYINFLPHQSILVVATQKVEEALKPLLLPHICTAHFNALRGINAFENCEAVVCIGRHEPFAKTELAARAYAATDVEPFMSVTDVEYDPCGYVQKSTRGIRLRSGKVKPVLVHVHPHPIVQCVIEQVREAEIVQGIDRVRPIHNRRHIYILNNLVSNITVDECIPFRKAMALPSRFEQAARRGSIVPYSPAEMHRIFPDLWRTQKIAEHDIQETPKPQIDFIFGNLGFVEIKYKLLLDKRKPYTAWVKGNDLRATLEGVVGTVAIFHVVDA